jgi:hypothetical protein
VTTVIMLRAAAGVLSRALDGCPFVLIDRRPGPPPILIQSVELPDREERHPDVTGYYSRIKRRPRYEGNYRVRFRSKRSA